MAFKNPQEEIRSIMLNKGISYQWIAENLNTYYQKIQYAIESSKEISLSMYVAIMTLFENHGYIKNSSQRYGDLIEHTFKINSTIGESLKRMNENNSENLVDKKWSPDERLKARIRLEDIKKEIIEVIDGLLKHTYGEDSE